MPSPIAAIDLIKTAMRLIGVLATGETPSADQTVDGLSALNDVLETWSTESLAVYGSATQAFTTVANQASYTIGTGGNWNTPRPQSITDAFCTVSGVDFPIEIIGQTQYDAIPVKATGAQIPEQLAFVNAFPLALAYLWPTPSLAITVTLNLMQPLSSVATSATTISLPPGYTRALQYALAVELAPQYGIELSSNFGSIARMTHARIKRANRVPVKSSFDAALVSQPGVLWQRGY